ncbi:MAG: N-acyl homoserine lactonase family protein [Thermomicrobiales bacterium]
MTGGAASRLYLFQLGTASIPLGDQLMDMSFGCYLVQTADGKNVLIDTGLAADFVPPPEMPPLSLQPNVLEQLAALGVRPDDVDVVVSTHFDPDHAGYHDAFPNAEHVVQREHYESARGGHPRFAGPRNHWDHPALRYRLIDGDTELVPGVTLIATSGHAPGHQSVLVRLPRTGPVLLAIDAVVLERLFTPDRAAGPLDDDEEQLRASTSKLLDLAAREDVALVVFGHDGAQWQSLQTAPDWYE